MRIILVFHFSSSQNNSNFAFIESDATEKVRFFKVHVYDVLFYYLLFITTFVIISFETRRDRLRSEWYGHRQPLLFLLKIYHKRIWCFGNVQI